MSTHTFVVSKNLARLKTTWSVENEFQHFVVRKTVHNDKEQKMLCKDSPNLFLEEVPFKFENHLQNNGPALN